MSRFVFSRFCGKYVIFCKDLGEPLKYGFLNGSLEEVKTEDCIYAVCGRDLFVRRNGIKTLMPRQRKLNGGRDLVPLNEEVLVIPYGTKIGSEIDSSKLRFRNEYEVKRKNSDEKELEYVEIYCYDPRVLAMSSVCADIWGCDPSTLARLGRGKNREENVHSILERLNPSKEVATEYLRKNRYTYKRPLTNLEECKLLARDPEWGESVFKSGDVTPLLEELERQERQTK